MPRSARRWACPSGRCVRAPGCRAAGLAGWRAGKLAGGLMGWVDWLASAGYCHALLAVWRDRHPGTFLASTASCLVAAGSRAALPPTTACARCAMLICWRTPCCTAPPRPPVPTRRSTSPTATLSAGGRWGRLKCCLKWHETSCSCLSVCSCHAGRLPPSGKAQNSAPSCGPSSPSPPPLTCL